MEENKDSVTESIESGKYTVAAPRKGRSFVWDILSNILKSDGTILPGFLFCRNCNSVVRNTHRQNIKRHICCKLLKDSLTIKPVSADDKAEIIEKCTNWLTQDCLPISAVVGDGFVQLVKFFIKIGAKYGEYIDVDDMLPDPAIISEKVKRCANEEEQQIKEEIDIVDSSFLKSPLRSEDSEPIVVNAAKKPKYSTDIPSPEAQSRPETHTPRSETHTPKLDPPSRQETYIRPEPLTSRQDPLQHVEKAVVNSSGNRDECDVFAEGWSIMYRKLTIEQRIYAKRLIDDTLMHAQLGQLTISSSLNLDPISISSNRFSRGQQQMKVQAYNNDEDNFSDA
ncbi:uncharacterized protein [Musca autumnalis]|uniref:uncharacterized protein n=1 Tax=Musca autumnalis TaxID=221902 RepID=UPI003CFB37A3